jgi:hypothetical protein
MSHRHQNKKSEVKATSCHVCKKNGVSELLCNSHNFRDHKGRIVCPNFLEKMHSSKCYKCDQHGHFADHCPGTKTHDLSGLSKIFRFTRPATVKPEPVKVAPKSTNAFDALADDSSDAEGELSPNVTVRAKPAAKLAANVTLRVAHVQKSWADYSDDEDEEEAPAFVYETPKKTLADIAMEPSSPRKRARSPSPMDWDNLGAGMCLFRDE